MRHGRPYRLKPGSTYHRDDHGAVIEWNTADRRGIAFWCPCGTRQVSVHEPPHRISFDAEGFLTIEGSCGSRADQEQGRPKNWCHFFIRAGGVVEMCGDAKCPGALTP